MAENDVDNFLSSMEQKLGGVPCNFDNFEPRPVFPGEDVTESVTLFGKKIVTGAGLHHERERVLATQAGVLSFIQPNVYWVEHFDHRYLPRLEDNVIGVVKEAYAESYRMDIGGSSSATLSALAFDGASKRNKPNLPVGALIFCRVVKVDRDMDPELSCAVASGTRKGWMTGQSIYGELHGGTVFQCSLSQAEDLLDPECPVLFALAKSIAFELAIGVNGFVWVNAESSDEIALIISAIKASESISPPNVPGFVQNLVKTSLKKKEDIDEDS